MLEKQGTVALPHHSQRNTILGIGGDGKVRGAK